MSRTRDHVSRPCELVFARLYTGSFFPFSRPRLRCLVLSALDFGEFRCFDGSIYRNLRELSLFILYDYEHDFESPWPWDVNRRNSYISLAVFRLHFSVDFYPVKHSLESVEKYSVGKIHKSDPEPRTAI